MNKIKWILKTAFWRRKKNYLSDILASSIFLLILIFYGVEFFEDKSFWWFILALVVMVLLGAALEAAFIKLLKDKNREVGPVWTFLILFVIVMASIYLQEWYW
ncbi:hypothetical protein [Bacillus massiliglaciei]|uniref:hypothetical protein n=1 Tax=Bacillus massiliglaciei TaxID=1816693 RepID=UPI000DA5F134|nr:hypothetical protein [Bacillus massiliglaciei]